MADEKQNTKSTSPPQVEKYLTEMKELPNYNEGKKEIPKTSKIQPKGKMKDGGQPKVVKEESLQMEKSPKLEDDKSEKLITTKDILLSVINIASLALMVILLIKLPQKAQELNKLRNQVLLSESEVALEISEVEGSKDKAAQLTSLFIDEVGLVNFVSDVEGLKGEDSSIRKINITSQKVLKDKTGSFGIPVVIEMRGNWIQFGQDMENIQALPYLFRAIRIETEEFEEEGVIGLRYGGFLYVDDKLGEN